MVQAKLNPYEPEVNIQQEECWTLSSTPVIILPFVKSLTLWFTKDTKNLVLHFMVGFREAQLSK